ncbi:CBO0543 family protein [Bacillus sp. Marseille-P3661]|uniref:CBO0543 family protein n=1 Tax=Bacillus sp. Marseille-P3661 TaxID=1936234 RepID=UPI000C826249|nr:CBO0543 family protein [Bacillus sp. Marseille-P3661]
MHLLLSIIMIVIVWKAGNWRNWQKYHTVMLYFALGNLLYNFLTANHFLWRLDADFISTHTLTEMLYTFIVFPATALLFIGNYPEDKGIGRVFLHYVWYIGWYAGIEWIFVKTGHIEYQYGWSYSWSVFFDCFMFPMLRLFYKKPLIAYMVTLLIVVFFIWWFEIPVHIPVEERGK